MVILRDFASLLKLGIDTINRDLQYLRQQSKDNIKKYVDEKFPNEYEKCLIELNAILRESWLMAQKTESERQKLQSLNLAKECYDMRLDL